MSSCRKAWHVRLARAKPERTKEEPHTQFAECFQRVSLPLELKDFLEDKRLYWHDFPQMHKKVAKDPKGNEIVTISLGEECADFDWDPIPS